MELERLSVALRPRNHWEAIDLGVRFALSRARPLYGAWFAVTLPVLALLCLVFALWLGEISWVPVLMWWLKPAFDRVALHVVSHAVFGDIPSLRETLHALPQVLRQSRLLAALTWERFSLTRGIRLPVDQLEGLRGKAGRQRKHLLGRRIGNAATWHTLAWLHLETILWMGLLGLIWLLIPEDLMPSGMTLWKLLTSQALWFSCLLYLPLLLCSLLLEPLYVAGGFMLYIKRRTDLEAWDVELQFRRIARSHATRSGLASLAGAALLGLLLALASPGKAEAASSAELREHRIDQSAEAIQQVMQDPAFGKEERERSLHWRSSDEPKKDAFKLPDELGGLFKGLGEILEGIGAALAMLGRIGGWLLILGVLGLLLYLASRFGWLKAQEHRSAPPAELAGFDIRPQSLPDDLAAAARALLAAGDARGALSLLFRGSLSRLAHREQVVFARGDTEGDCLDRTRQQAPARAPYLARLLGCWQRLAYAHHQVAADEIESLCQDWHKFFGEMPRG